jgi:hypothetical protein
LVISCFARVYTYYGNTIFYLTLDDLGELLGVTNLVIDLELLMKNGKISIHPDQDKREEKFYRNQVLLYGYANKNSSIS